MAPRHFILNRLFFVLAFVGLFACQHISIPYTINYSNSKTRVSEIDPVYGLLLMDLLAQQKELTPDECMKTYVLMNLSWPFPDYYERISSDTKDYETIIGIDSTIDMARHYEDFLNSNETFSVAVAGNTACDAIAQLGAIKTSNPKNFVISTADGNGLLRGVDPDYSVLTVERLISKIRDRWPEIRIAVVGIHPTQIPGINTNKDYTNSQIETYMQSLENTCYYDPLPLFGVGPGEPPPTSLMIDTLHYNKTISFQIKDKLQTQCNISL